MLVVVIYCSLLISCSTSIDPPNGMVSWQLANTTGTNLLMTVYDNVCRRSYFRVAVQRSRETTMETCATLEGQADIRYRRRSQKMSEDNPWIEAMLSANQALLVR